MIKLVVFDWNGTLLSDTQATVHAENVVNKRFGKKPISIRQYRESSTVPWTQHMLKWGYSKKEMDENFQEIQNLFHAVYEQRAKHCRSRAGARRLLAFLERENIDKIIASNHVVEGINSHLHRLKLSNYFKHTLAHEDKFGSRKKRVKEKKIAGYIKTHGYKPNEVAIVGDSDEEIHVAKKLGLVSIAITHGIFTKKRLQAEKPDFIVSSLDKIIPIIEEINSKK